MVGTAVYHVGRYSSIQSRMPGARKPGVQVTLAPAASEDSSAAIRPWTWNRGMILRHESAGESPREERMLWAEVARAVCVKGTILGFDVVPEV